MNAPFPFTEAYMRDELAQSVVTMLAVNALFTVGIATACAIAAWFYMR